jgi:hypothetical protein
MNTADRCLRPAPRRRDGAAALIRLATSPRFAVYLSCTLAAVLANFVLGKEMMWDTTNYHLYAGFSALHDRLGLDYFPAGPQSYFNPYIYVPFYLLATSALPAIAATSLLAIVQSAILWITYEIALQVAPSEERKVRVTAAACAVALAFANPILIGELGSSYADISTGELVLAAWLLLIRNVRSPTEARNFGAGLLLGAVSALKLTNAAHALAAFVLVLFVPARPRARLRYLAGFALALGIGFAAVATPWAIRLEHAFGNPFFPLLNGIFRSPQYSTGTMLDYQFIPGSLAEALWRPFAISEPRRWVDNGLSSPDLRYVLLLAFGVVALARWLWRRFRRPSAGAQPQGHAAVRCLAALGCAFLVDWVIWLRESGDGRYFLPMACVAGILVVALIYQRLAGRARVRNYLLLAIFCAQATQLALGAQYRYSAPWDRGSWFQLALPKKLQSTPALYFTFGDPPNAFMAPFLPRGSGIVNIGGAYALSPDGANGEQVKRLIHRFAPHLQILLLHTFDPKNFRLSTVYLSLANEALEAFGLRLERGNCVRIAVSDSSGSVTDQGMELMRSAARAVQSTGYLVSCGVGPAPAEDASVRSAKAVADRVFDRLEKACPTLFQPTRPTTQEFTANGIQAWRRYYSGTRVSAIVGSFGVVVDYGIGGGPSDVLGKLSDWERLPPRLVCGRRNDLFYAKLLPDSP